MATHPDYPGASSRLKNGREVWRYRHNRSAAQASLPGKPGEPEFEIAFTNALQQQGASPRKVFAMPGAALPKTFGAAERLLLASSDWAELDPDTHRNKNRYRKYFLDCRIAAGSTATWRDAPVDGMDFHRLDALIATVKREAGNNIAKRWLEQINDLLMTALRAKWIPMMPSYGLRVRPTPSDGHKEWPRELREQFEAYHPIGSAARTCYTLAFWLGNRRSDITRVSWQHQIRHDFETEDGEVRVVEAFEFRQRKNHNINGGAQMFLPILPGVEQALAPLSRDTKTVLAKRNGEPFSDKALTMRMQVWTRQAGLPKGYTVHGLRKSLGNHLAELGLSARQIQEVLGHTKLSSTDPYVKKADKKRLAIDSYDAVERGETRRRLRVVK